MSTHDPGRDLRVLVVDDDRGARLLHGRFVDDAPGFVVVGRVGAGAAVVDVVRRHAVDLVLLDMRLPDISGVEVLHRLRAAGLDRVDVLVISSAQDRVTVRQALAGRVVGYLVKPFTQENLLARLAAYRADRAHREDRRERDDELGQGEIDRLLAPGSTAGSTPGSSQETPPARTAPRGRGASGPGSVPEAITPEAALPRGIAAATLTRVLAALDPVEPLTAAELASRCGLSRATARRYVDHLVAAGRIDRAHRYGRRGRPEVLYRLAP